MHPGAGGTAAHGLREVKKEAMVADAAALLDGKGWLPWVLRVPGVLSVVRIVTGTRGWYEAGARGYG